MPCLHPIKICFFRHVYKTVRVLLTTIHPQRPRGSQSGWEKRWDESFQNVPPAFSPDPTDCRWVSEDDNYRA